MNKLVLILMTLLMVTISANARDIRENQVPEKVKSYVTTNYPQAGSRKWEHKNKDHRLYYYRVEFKVNGKEVRLELEEDGSLISSREEISDSEIPEFIREYVQKNYNEVSILGVRKETERGETHYDVGVRFKNSSGYTRHRNIHFDTEGNLINR